ncbi:MAG TPA: glycosyltransferase [Chitinophagaceae bacterium]|nr:glycosyltransferase [Chitinophagaceae bacterium]
MNHHFISNRDIVMFSFQSWDTEIGSNFKDMALELAKKNRVLFINRALDRSSLRKNKNDAATTARLLSIRKGIHEIEQVAPNIWVHNPRVMMESINRIPFAGLHDWLNKHNSKKLTREINKTIATLQFSNVLLMNDNDFIRGFYLKEMIACSDYIFYIRDYMLAVDFFKRHGPRLEKGVMQKADMVVANSEYLANYARQQNPNSFYIGQGCDFSAFLEPGDTVPEDLATISHPIIGYTGFVSAWRIDIDIIKHIAERFPAYNIVLVGPVDWMFKKDKLAHLKNVHFLGGKPPAVLVHYIRQFDVCINPQIVNDVTRGNYPRKADEYLAMGKPLVATATEGMKMFADHCYLCNTPAEYAEKIEFIINNRQIADNDTIKRSRQEFALKHTWEESIGMLGDAYHAVKTKHHG